MSEATTYRGREQMDAVKARAAQAEAAATSRRTNALTSIDIEEAREKARERKDLRNQAAKTKKVEEKAKRREKAALARKARNERLAAAVGQPLPWVMVVVITSIAFAFPGQFSAVTGLGVFWLLALMVPVFIEGATWAMAWLRKWAVANNKPAKLYMLMTWLFASIAAGLNAWHHLDKPQLAVVFAASSLFGVAVFEIYMHSQQHEAAWPRRRRHQARAAAPDPAPEGLAPGFVAADGDDPGAERGRSLEHRVAAGPGHRAGPDEGSPQAAQQGRGQDREVRGAGLRAEADRLAGPVRGPARTAARGHSRAGLAGQPERHGRDPHQPRVRAPHGSRGSARN